MPGSRDAKDTPTARDADPARGASTTKDVSAETARLNRGFGWIAALGVVLVVEGLVGLVYVGVATLTSMVLFGWLLLIGGAVGCCTPSRPAAATSSGSASWSPP